MPSQGTLISRVYTSDAMIPVSDATVTVTRKLPTGEVELLGVRQTDRSGLTQSLSIETPDPSESLQPGDTMPFTDVDITCDHPEYERIFVENVQIFPNVESVQDFELIPLQAFPDQFSQTEIFHIPPQNL